MNAFEKIKEKIIMKLNYSSGYPNCSEYDYAYECAMHDARKKAIEIVEQEEKEHNNGWIQCSERLPERNKDVLCWVKSKTISGTETYIIGSCDNGFWFLKTYEIDRESFPVKDYEVVAWQPLPGQYQESENERKCYST